MSGNWTPYVVESLEPDPELLAPATGAPALFIAAPPEPDPVPVPGASSTAPEPRHRNHGTEAEGTGRAPGTGSADGTGTEVATAPVQRAGTGTLALLWLREHAAQAAENQRRHRTFWHWIWAGLVSRAETLAEHRDYLKSRAWLEDYMTGWVRDFIERENVLYGIFVARTVKFICQNTDKVFERQLRFWAAVGIFLIGLAIWRLTH